MSPYKISWRWLAGFTDGDGTITVEFSKGKYRYSRIRWHQKESESFVLDEIGRFLSARGLKVTSRNFSVARAGHLYPQRELAITNAADTLRALKKMRQHLVVKRHRAEETIAILERVHRLKARYGWKYRVHMK